MNGMSRELRMEKGESNSSGWIRSRHVLAMLAFLLPSPGCLTPSPFRDEIAAQPPVTTPSMDGVRESGAEPNVPAPIGDPKFVFSVDGTVLHRPLYFEDPREVTGSEDGAFAWTGDDYVYLFTGPVRFLVNAATVPFDMVVYPPSKVMASDGHPSRKVLWWWVDSERANDDDSAAPALMVVTEEAGPVEQ
jgi:hypothetical protein